VAFLLARLLEEHPVLKPAVFPVSSLSEGQTDIQASDLVY
jgi:hypothetical protein